MIDLCSLHLEIKSESNLITEEQRNPFKLWALPAISITLSGGRKCRWFSEHAEGTMLSRKVV